MGPKIASQGWSETYKMQQLKQCTATATTPIVLHADMVPLCQFFCQHHPMPLAGNT